MLLAILFLVLLMIAAAISIRERYVARRAGMSSTRPVCAACMYPLGGWSTSRCPECGADAQEVGVRIGPETPRHVLSALIVLVGIFGIGHLGFAAFGWLFATAQFNWHAHWSAAGPPQYHVTTTASWRWRRFPQRNDLAGDIQFVRLGNSTDGAWVNGRWRGQEPEAKWTIDFAEGDAAPTRTAIAEAVSHVAGSTPADQQQAQIDALHGELASIWASAATGDFGTRNYAVPPPGGFFTGGSGGYGGGRGAHWLASVCSLVVVVAFIVASARAVNRRYRPGRRGVEPGEWGKT